MIRILTKPTCFRCSTEQVFLHSFLPSFTVLIHFRNVLGLMSCCHATLQLTSPPSRHLFKSSISCLRVKLVGLQCFWQWSEARVHTMMISCHSYGEIVLQTSRKIFILLRWKICDSSAHITVPLMRQFRPPLYYTGYSFSYEKLIKLWWLWYGITNHMEKYHNSLRLLSSCFQPMGS